jgi:hypothetical protein
MAQGISVTYAAMILGAVFVTMSGEVTVMTDKVVVGISGYDGDAGRCGGRWGCRTFAIMCGMVRRERSRCACNMCLVGRSGVETQFSTGWYWPILWLMMTGLHSTTSPSCVERFHILCAASLQ